MGGAAAVSPVLIPSVSSKGFPVVNDIAEPGMVLKVVASEMSEALLVSAYDLHFQLLPDTGDLGEDGVAPSLYDTPRLLVIDSGGYETSDISESGIFPKGDTRRRTYTRADFEGVVRRLPPWRKYLVVTYDEPTTDRESVEEQLERGELLAAETPEVDVDLLLKPPGTDRVVALERIARSLVPRLCAFAAVGISEKELGDTLMDRVATVARMRRLMDDHGADAVPLHVFGALNPLTVSLYFAAGAELFDGLSWLRYGWLDGRCVHPEEYALLSGSFYESELERDIRRSLANLTQIGRLKQWLTAWAAGDQCKLPEAHLRVLREADGWSKSAMRGG